MKKNLKGNKKLKNITIILSIILVILDICLYVKMKSTWSDIGVNYAQYENTSLLIAGLFRYGTLIWGILSIAIVWIEYFLVKLFMNIYNKFYGLKKIILSIMISVIIITIFIFFIRIMSLIIITLI